MGEPAVTCRKGRFVGFGWSSSCGSIQRHQDVFVCWLAHAVARFDKYPRSQPKSAVADQALPGFLAPLRAERDRLQFIVDSLRGKKQGLGTAMAIPGTISANTVAEIEYRTRIIEQMDSLIAEYEGNASS